MRHAVAIAVLFAGTGTLANFDDHPPRERLDDPPGVRPELPAGVRTVVPTHGTMFASVQVNVDDQGADILFDAANEPSIAVDPTAPNRIVIGWRQFDTIESNFRQAGVGYSHDGGRTWTNLPPLEAGIFRSDPVLSADAEGRVYYNSLTVPGFLCDFFISDDGGATWSDPIPAFGGDKAWFTIVGGGETAHIYSSWSVNAGCCGQATFTRSLDAADTFFTPITLPGTPIFGTLATAPDGALYIAGVNPSDAATFRVTRSTNPGDPVRAVFDDAVDVDMNGNLVFGGVPNPSGLLGQVQVAVNSAPGEFFGDVYLLGSTNPPGDDPLDVHLARSVDGGQTWSNPVRVNDDPPASHAWQWFGTMSVAPNGRIDVIFNDTRDDPDVAFSTLYYTFSHDGGQTFAPSEAVSIPFNHSLGYPNQQKLGDYYDMISDDVGAHLAWAATFTGGQDVYYLRIGDYDCNGNGVADTIDLENGTSADCDEDGIPDECAIAAGTVEDANHDGVPDVCETPGDVNMDGVVNFCDLLLVLSTWGECPPGGPCPTDVDGDLTVGLRDLLIVLSNWS